MPDVTDRPLKVFLCHASQDKAAVRELYQFLRQNGIDSWLDEAKIKPGQEWRIEIPKAIRESDAIIVCLSGNSITKEGYVQKEIKEALDIADEKPEGTIFIIPARLDECKVPDRLSRWQWVDLFREWGHGWLLQGLELRASSLRLQITYKPYTGEVFPPFASPLQATKQNTSGMNQVLSEIESRVFGEMVFVKIPKGETIIGSKLVDNLAWQDEVPQHAFVIPYDYWIGKYPVLRREFAEYVESTLSFKDWGEDWKEKLDHPAVNISFYKALKFCDWFNDRYGLTFPKGYVARLPTEVEWERAARGADGRIWPWGNKFQKSLCNSKESQIANTTPVGKYSPKGDSPYGVVDMAGNVWEWSISLYGEDENDNAFRYPYDSEDGREDIRAGKEIFRVMKGGSFLSEIQYTRAATREQTNPESAGSSDGFRLVIGPPK